MARLKFIGLFTLSHGGNRNQQGGHVPLMWPATFFSGLAVLPYMHECVPFVFELKYLFFKPEFVCYNDGCYLWRYATNPCRWNLTPQSIQLANTEIVVDKLHMVLSTLWPQIFQGVGKCVLHGVIRYYYANLICRLYRLTPKCVSNTSCGFWSMPGWLNVWATKSSCSLFCTLWTCIAGGRNANSIEEDSLL